MLFQSVKKQALSKPDRYFRLFMAGIRKYCWKCDDSVNKSIDCLQICHVLSKDLYL